MPKKEADPFSCFELGDSGRWRAVMQARDENDRLKPKIIERKSEDAARKAMRAWILENNRLNPSPHMSVDAMIEVFIKRCEERNRAPKTLKDYRRYREVYNSSIGHIPVNKLMPMQVEGALSDMPGTKDAINARNFLRAAINKVARKVAPDLANVAAIAEPPQHEPQVLESLTEKRLAKILSLETDEFRHTLWVLYASVGVRPVSGRTLLWSELEEREDGLWIRKAQAKTPEGRKPIPVPTAVAEALRKLPIRGRYVFPNPVTGKPYAETTIRDYWAEAVERAELPHITLYQLRHLFGTVTARRVKDHILARLMTHTDVRTTKKYYVDEEELELRKAVDGS